MWISYNVLFILNNRNVKLNWDLKSVQVSWMIKGYSWRKLGFVLWWKPFLHHLYPYCTLYPVPVKKGIILVLRYRLALDNASHALDNHVRSSAGWEVHPLLPFGASQLSLSRLGSLVLSSQQKSTSHYVYVGPTRVLEDSFARKKLICCRCLLVNGFEIAKKMVDNYSSEMRCAR